MPVGIMQLPSGKKLKLPMSKPFEELLISTLNPVLNLKKMYK